MCRSIQTLFNVEPPATEAEIRAAALQFVRKVTGFNRVSRVNGDAFDQAVAEVAAATDRLLAAMTTAAPARDRIIEAEKARRRAQDRYA